MDIQKENELKKSPEPAVSPEAPKVEKEVSPEAAESRNEQAISDELKREIELMQLDENLKDHAQEKSQKIRLMAQDDKLENLLEMAKDKGVAFAIKVAQSMNDPYLMDTFHDLLAKEGFYSQFKK